MVPVTDSARPTRHTRAQESVLRKCFLFQPEIQKQIIMAGPKQHPDDSALQSFSSKPQKTKTHMFFSFLWTHLLFLPVGKSPLWPLPLTGGVPVGLVTLFAGVLAGKIWKLLSL